jgi:hypothetical protein
MEPEGNPTDPRNIAKAKASSKSPKPPKAPKSPKSPKSPKESLKKLKDALPRSCTSADRESSSEGDNITVPGTPPARYPGDYTRVYGAGVWNGPPPPGVPASTRCEWIFIIVSTVTDLRRCRSLHRGRSYIYSGHGGRTGIDAIDASHGKLEELAA